MNYQFNEKKMDDLENFLSGKAPLVKKVITGGTTGGRVKVDEPKPVNRRDDIPCTSQYAEEYVAENQQQLLNRFNNFYLRDSVAESEHFDCDGIEEIYTKYNFKSSTSMLPITSYKNEILKRIDGNSFVVLEGPTACGKTTQVPQFIIDDAYKRNKKCNIIIAQPRRIAAASNAERISNERDWPLGTLVGYQIGFDEKKHISSDTRILFCTTGILLEKLIRAKHFHNFTHIILDEVHERNKDMDFLFVVIKKLFVSVEPKPTVKIIIMSATIQATRFSEYFTFPKDGIMQPAPIVTVQQTTRFRVDEFYLEEFYKIIPKLDYKKIENSSPAISSNLYKIAAHLINHFDTFDEKELHPIQYDNERPTVLVFLPGIHEIIEMESFLSKDQWNNLNKNRTRVEVIILHSSSDSQQRNLAFRKAPAKTRKIILATNIAESSITVPDVKYVLDFCRTRIMTIDTTTNFSALKLSWAARNSCKQRAGRTGRVMNGRCYRFVEKPFYYNALLEDAIPELVSSPLENVILKAKLLDMGSPLSILALAMDCPKLNDIANTILILKEIGALLRTCDDQPSDMDGDISFIGRIMANLPIDVKVAKFIILGYCFSILDECIIIGAALNARSIFRDKNYAKENLKLYSQLLRWANSSGSDLFAMLHAYNSWIYAHERQLFGNISTTTQSQRKREEREWADQFCLDIDALYECRVQIAEIKKRLERMNITSGQGSSRVQWNDNEKSIILKVVIAGAFYPNVFARVSLNSDDYTRDAFQSIGTRDPRNTVYYKGFDRDHLRWLYKKEIQRILTENNVVPVEMVKNIRVNFDTGSNKTFVTFQRDDTANYRFENGNESMPGKVCTEVYKSLKMKDLKIPTEFWIMKSRADEIDYAVKNGVKYPEEGKNVELDEKTFCLPRILDKKMRGIITNVESCSRFWFQPESEIEEVLKFETYVRNYRKELLKASNEQIAVGQIMIAEIESGKGFSYHRAKINSAHLPNAVCRIRLIDTGEIRDCQTKSIYEYCSNQRTFMDLPPRCFECGLAQVQPSRIRYPNEHWPSDAVKLFKDLTNHKTIKIKVYSVTNGTANVFVRCQDVKGTINEILIDKNFAEFIEEDYISKYNHLMRDQQRQDPLKMDNFIDPMVIEHLKDENTIEIEPPPSIDCAKKLKLDGPYSSLSISTYGLTEATKNAKIRIDRHSVNSIMLENDPQDMSEKYLIAATICYTNLAKKDIHLRYTTQMPNIRGFGPLMALIFCPTMQVKRNKEKTHYTVIRTGLGYDKANSRPMFEEHDIVFHLDVEITQHDIELVNQIRYLLDTLLLTYPGEDQATHISDKNKREILLKIKSVIVKLLERPRQCINKDDTSFDWDPQFTESPDYIKSLANELYGNRAIFPLHNTLKTNSDFDTDRKLMQIHCNELHDLTEIVISLQRPVLCRLCNMQLVSIAPLKMHLLSQIHRDNEKRINFKR